MAKPGACNLEKAMPNFNSFRRHQRRHIKAIMIAIKPI